MLTSMPHIIMARRLGDNFFYPVLVDEDIHARLIHETVVIGKDGYPKVLQEGYKWKRLHRLVTGVDKKEGSIHHLAGKRDCRRQYLRVYDSYEKHKLLEHPHHVHRCKRDKRLAIADLHPHCG